MVANTWIEGTTRCAGELGYQVTLVPDATAAHMAEEAGLSVWLSAYRYSRLKAGVTPSNALPDDPRMISACSRPRGAALAKGQRRNQSVRGIPEMRPHSASNAS